jgi:hypothetical protein
MVVHRNYVFDVWSCSFFINSSPDTTISLTSSLVACKKAFEEETSEGNRSPELTAFDIEIHRSFIEGRRFCVEKIYKGHS